MTHGFLLITSFYQKACLPSRLQSTPIALQRGSEKGLALLANMNWKAVSNFFIVIAFSDMCTCLINDLQCLQVDLLRCIIQDCITFYKGCTFFLDLKMCVWLKSIRVPLIRHFRQVRFEQTMLEPFLNCLRLPLTKRCRTSSLQYPL